MKAKAGLPERVRLNEGLDLTIPFRTYPSPQMNSNNFSRLLAACSVVFTPIFATAAPIDPNDSVASWSRASFSERQAYAKRTIVICKSSSCGSVEVRACMDEALRPPLPSSMKALTIGEAAVSCVSILNAQK